MLPIFLACAPEPVVVTQGSADYGADALRDDDDTGSSTDTGADDSGDPGDVDTWDTADDDDEGGDGDWSEVQDRTYGFGLEDGTIVEPSGGEALVAGAVQQLVLFSVLDFGTDTIDAVGALSVDDRAPIEQDWCAPSFGFPGTRFEDGRFQAGPIDTTLLVSGIPTSLEQVVISGEFDADLEEFDQGTLDGYLDASALDDTLGDGSRGSACANMAMLGVYCEDCPVSASGNCLHVRVEDINAPVIDGLELVEVFGTNCEGCDRAPPAEDAVCE